MTSYKEGDAVRLVINGKIQGRGVVMRVGATCLYCVDYDDNPFHSHTENFVLDEVTPASSEQVKRLVPRHRPNPRAGNREAHSEPVGPFYPTTQAAAAAEAERKPIVIGIAGRRGHGKDTAAKALEGFENVKFAGPIKAMARAFFAYIGMNPATINRVVDGDMKETPLDCLGGKTGRYLQQVIGTEMGRDLIWDRIWINAAKMRAAQFPKVAITDLRFPNEREAIADEMGGVTMRVRNPRIEVKPGEHPSEDLVDTLQVQFEIANDGTIEDLHEKVRAVLVASGVRKRYVEQF